MEGQGPTRRFSLENSRGLAELARHLIAKVGLRSTYELFLQTALPRATLHLWLSGRVRIPIDRGREIFSALALYGGSDEPLLGFEEILLAERDRSALRERLRDELRLRRVPVERTIDALRAANVLPGNL